ncbi:MAG: signal peptidase II [Lachnospiraceae bacterium]|nr:signal peptidase II [Lachnospiraceae bacterium]
MSKKKSLIYSFAALVVLIGLDQLTKQMAVKYLYQQKPVEIIPGVFELNFLVNRGAAFGILQNHQIFFAVITCIVLCVLVYVYVRIPCVHKYAPFHILLVLLTAGAAGNFLDRVRLGYVIDFFYFKLIDFPIFNVADCYVVVSVILLAVLILLVYKDKDLDELGAFIKPSRRKDL